METMQLVYDKAAQDAGVFVISACGFDSIPADMGVIFLEREFDGMYTVFWLALYILNLMTNFATTLYEPCLKTRHFTVYIITNDEITINIFEFIDDRYLFK